MTDADYIFLADQDDVWLPSKVSAMVSTLQDIELLNGKKFPAIVYSDYFTVNAQDSPVLFDRYKDRQAWYSNISLEMLLVRGRVAGCAMAFNRAVLEIALPIPEEIKWHDHWLTLVACSCGELFHVPVTTTLYRIHGRNTIGIKEKPTLFNRVKRWFQLENSTISLFPFTSRPSNSPVKV